MDLGYNTLETSISETPAQELQKLRARLLHQFLNGLSPRLQTAVAATDFGNLEDAIRTAQRVARYFPDNAPSYDDDIDSHRHKKHTVCSIKAIENKPTRGGKVMFDTQTQQQLQQRQVTFNDPQNQSFANTFENLNFPVFPEFTRQNGYTNPPPNYNTQGFQTQQTPQFAYNNTTYYPPQRKYQEPAYNNGNTATQSGSFTQYRRGQYVFLPAT